MDDTYISTKEAADILDLKRDQIVDFIRAGQIVAIDVSRGGKRPHWRISRASFASFIKARTHTPTPATEPRRRSRD